jgi:hypothetical protein
MYRIAGIDVHKKKLAVVVTDVEVHSEHQFERCWFGPTRSSSASYRNGWRSTKSRKW